ncbi:hypothetical protein GCM10010156_50940 [Planobispora rosea]|uniref:Uncharacterized protein n=1 Tax=Planobispora rosea TaxID=35762 RepID=A0A8J3S6V5_PLARO|nr:hypothetical protein [Planobispora rosea]GGS86220.1 hypothetical protein GCM10010156_50940 [Planobispora rosea]GIH89032.1 hypothetical protein Pro02_74400 [Planobispora rosea]
MPGFDVIAQGVDPRWVRELRMFALQYEEERHKVRASWIPDSVDDETWFELYLTATSVEQDIALI